MYSAPSDNKKSRWIGISATVLLHAAVLIACVAIWLRYTPGDSPAEEPREEEHDITFEEVVELISGGTYVQAEFLPPEPTPQLSQGANVESAPPLPPEPTQEEIEERKREEISRKVTFRTSTVKPEEGDGGDSETTVAAPAADSQPQLIGLEGYTLGYYAQPHGKSTGVIAIAVTVGPDGAVIAASFYGPRTTYDVIRDPKAKKECIEAALSSKFTVPRGTDSNVSGYILYRF